MKSNYIEEMTNEAIEILKQHEPDEGYYCAFSGGKDSMVVYDLLKKSGCKFDAHFAVTTVDPPDLLKFIREYYQDVQWHRPELTMFQLIEKWGFASRKRRWCCAILKEEGGSGRVVVTGIRNQESADRGKRLLIETSITDQSKTILNPIIKWKFHHVWQYIQENKLPYCCLYDEGWKRIGCIGCPKSNYKDNSRAFRKYPMYKVAYMESWRRHVAYLDSREKSFTYPREPEKAFDLWIKGITIDEFNADEKQLKFDF